MNSFKILSCLLIILQIIPAHANPNPIVNPTTNPNEVVCVSDGDGDGDADNEGDTSVCQSNPEKTAYFCPIGAVECDKVTDTNIKPSVQTCPVGYTMNAAKTTCTREDYSEQQPSNNCPANYTYNASTGVCQMDSVVTSPPVLSCPSGYTLDSSRETCTKSGYTYQPVTNNCPSGYSYNPEINLCFTGSNTSSNPTWSCPAGQTLENGQCYTQRSSDSCRLASSTAPRECRTFSTSNRATSVKPPNGPEVWTFIWGNASSPIPPNGYNAYGLQDGWVYFSGTFANGNASGGGVYISNYGICRCAGIENVLVGSATAQCASGTFNSASGMCESNSVVTSPATKSCASGYSYNAANNNCERLEVTTVPVGKQCADGVYSAISNLCEKSQTSTVAVTKKCPNDFTYNPQKNMCERTIVTTIAVQQICDADFTYNPATGVCEQKVLRDSCPLQGGGVCVANLTGKAYCSRNTCFNKSEENIIDNIDGKMLTNNGSVDETGYCTDQLYIMSGRASRCNKSGASTGFKNCCKDDGKIAQDTVGTISEITLAIKAIKGIYEAATVATAAYTAAASQGAGTAAASQAAGEAFTQSMASTGVGIVVAVVVVVVMEYFMQACDSLSMETSMLSSSGMCHELGTYCTKKWLGSCVQKARSFCCFDTKMARIIHEQGRPQLSGFNTWGEVNDPICRGFTPEEFAQLDFDKIDLTEYYEDLIHETQQNINESLNKSIQDFYENTTN